MSPFMNLSDVGLRASSICLSPFVCQTHIPIIMCFRFGFAVASPHHPALRNAQKKRPGPVHAAWTASTKLLREQCPLHRVAGIHLSVFRWRASPETANSRSQCPAAYN
jgi:hypothetical protein